jgi:hypothetical protein
LSSSSAEEEEEEDARRTRTVPRLGLTRDDEENEDVFKLLQLVAALRALVCACIFTSPRAEEVRSFGESY